MKKVSVLVCGILFSVLMAKSQMADFETWTNYNSGGVALSVPTTWHGLDSSITFYGSILNLGAPFYAQVEKETPGYSSTAALRVVTKNQSALTGIIPAGPFPSLASNAVITVNTSTGGFDLFGGWYYLNDPVSASMWVKNAPVGGDSTEITLLAIDNSDGGDSIAGIADTLLGANIPTWTKITLPFQYGSSGFSTHLIRVLITSSGNFSTDTTTGAFTNLHDGTSLSVDDIDIIAPNGVAQYIYSSKLADVYPSIVQNDIHVNLQSLDPSALYEFEVMDMKGARVISLPIRQIINAMDLSFLKDGSYLFSIRKDHKIVQTGKFIRK